MAISPQQGGTGYENPFDDEEMLRLLRGEQPNLGGTNTPAASQPDAVVMPGQHAQPRGTMAGTGSTSLPDTPAPTTPLAYRTDRDGVSSGQALPTGTSTGGGDYENTSTGSDAGQGSFRPLPAVGIGNPSVTGGANTSTNAAAGGGSDRARIDAMLQAVQSTDDPNYWYRLAEQHGGLDAMGVEWTRDRINRGDGSMLVKSGQLQKFQDTGGGGYDVPGYENPNDPAIHQAILDLLKRGTTPVTGDDPSIRAQFNPQDQIIQRNQSRAQAAVAEREFAQGNFGTNAIDADANKIQQASGLDSANLMGSLVQTEMQSRRQDVVNAITFAQGEDKLALTKYLSLIDAELRKMGISNQNTQFYDQLGVGIGNREADYNQELLRLLSTY